MTLDRRALIISGLAVAAAAPMVARAAPLPAAPGDMVLGLPQAPAQFVVYASASCPHCAHWWTDVLPRVRKDFVDTGKVRLVFREFLTPPPEFAAAGFILARRIPGKYFEVLTTVFEKQAAIYESEKLWEGLEAIGKQYGLTSQQFAEALRDPKALEAVNARFARAQTDGIEGTPTFFVNGAQVDGTDFAALSRAFATAAKG
jgi:protein-disulfide isomerase